MLVAECVVTFGAEDFHISCMLWEITNKWYGICVCITGYSCAHLAAAHGKRSVLEAIMKAGVVSSETCTYCLEWNSHQKLNNE